MQTGTPCAMSSVAAEGMFGSMKPNGVIEDTADAFIARTVATYSNATEWEGFQQQGFSVLKNRFEKAEHQTRFLNRVKALQSNLNTHRLKISSDKCSATTKCKAQSIWRAGLKRRIRRLKYLKPLPYVLSS